jgi:hypothetical protein
MKNVVWSLEKAAILSRDPNRGRVTFEDCALAIEEQRVLAIEPNPSRNHLNQRMYVVEVQSYVYCVPFVEDENSVFLKTIFPSRKYTALYLGTKR